MASDITERINEVLKLSPEARHSYFQLKYFVLGKEPTLQAQMWQALRELQARKETIDSLEMELADMQDNLELVDIERERTRRAIFAPYNIATLPDELKNQEWTIKNRQFDRQKVILEKSLQKLTKKLDFAWQEARFFLQAFEGLNSIEHVKDYDDLESQKNYWNERITQHINLKLLLQQPLDIDMVQTALALHEDAPVKIELNKTLHFLEAKMKNNYLKDMNAKKSNES